MQLIDLPKYGEPHTYQSVCALLDALDKPEIPTEACDLTASVLATVLSELRTPESRNCSLVIGEEALMSLAAGDWFTPCFDVEKDLEQRRLGHLGSLFGAPVVVFDRVQGEVVRGLSPACVYVRPDNGGTVRVFLLR